MMNDSQLQQDYDDDAQGFEEVLHDPSVVSNGDHEKS
jgi:hypothetical protein